MIAGTTLHDLAWAYQRRFTEQEYYYEGSRSGAFAFFVGYLSCALMGGISLASSEWSVALIMLILGAVLLNVSITFFRDMDAHEKLMNEARDQYRKYASIMAVRGDG